MTKFPNREDQGYDAILGELQRWKKVAFQEKASKVFEPSTSVKQGRSQFGDTHAWNSQVVQGNFYNANFSQSS
jgi:hypothetical protein